MTNISLTTNEDEEANTELTTHCWVHTSLFSNVIVRDF